MNGAYYHGCTVPRNFPQVEWGFLPSKTLQIDLTRKDVERELEMNMLAI